MITKMGQSNEHAFARYMMANRERIVGRQELFEYIYPHSSYEDRRAYSRFGSLITRTNDWFSRENLPYMVACVKGRGYVLLPTSWLAKDPVLPKPWDIQATVNRDSELVDAHKFFVGRELSGAA